MQAVATEQMRLLFRLARGSVLGIPESSQGHTESSQGGLRGEQGQPLRRPYVLPNKDVQCVSRNRLRSWADIIVQVRPASNARCFGYGAEDCCLRAPLACDSAQLQNGLTLPGSVCLLAQVMARESDIAMSPAELLTANPRNLPTAQCLQSLRGAFLSALCTSHHNCVYEHHGRHNCFCSFAGSCAILYAFDTDLSGRIKQALPQLISAARPLRKIYYMRTYERSQHKDGRL